MKNEYQIEATIIEDVIYNQQAVEALAASRGVVLIEMVGATPYNDFIKELQLIKQLSIDVLGGVIVE